MKLVYRLLTCLYLSSLCLTPLQSQEPVQPAQTYVCAYAPLTGQDLSVCLKMQQNMGFRMNDKAIQTVLSKILSPVGLQPNFRMVSCDSISNCVAYTAPSGYRYILYDPAFLGQLADMGKSNWIYYSIFAHEVAHHLNQHLYLEKTLAEERQMELEADEWSGQVMALMGATLQEAQAGIMLLPDDESDNDSYSSHPAKAKRLAAIRKGFEKGSTFKLADRVEKTVLGEKLINHRIVQAAKLPGLQNLWDKQFYLQQVILDKGEWMMLMRRQDHDYNEGFFISDTLPYSQLSQYSFTNWNISTLEYLGNSWFVGMSKQNKSVEQEVAYGQLNVKQINQMGQSTDSLAKVLTDFGSNGQDGVALYDDRKPLRITGQQLLVNASFPEEQIMSMMENGFRVSRLKFFNNQWHILLNRYAADAPKFKQVFFAGTDSNFPLQKMEHYDNNEYYLQTAGTDGKRWIVVMNRAML